MGAEALEFRVHKPSRYDFRCAVSDLVDVQCDYLDLGVSERHIHSASHAMERNPVVFRAFQNRQPAVSPQEF